MSSENDWRPLLLDAHVQCARLGEVVELTRCLECSWLLDLDRAAGTPAVRCAAASRIPDGRRPDPTAHHID